MLLLIQFIFLGIPLERESHNTNLINKGLLGTPPNALAISGGRGAAVRLHRLCIALLGITDTTSLCGQ
jgi:hypothetical protein